MRQPAQQFRLRPAAFVTAIPQPALVAGNERNAAFADAVQGQQGAVVQPGHQDLCAVWHSGINQPEPATPAGAFACRGRRRHRLQPLCHRMALAQIANLRHKAFLEYPGRGRTRQDGFQRRAIDTFRPAIFRARGHQHRAAIAHVVRDIFQVYRWKNTAPAVAIKNDQIEVLDLLHEQLARGESDQR